MSSSEAFPVVQVTCTNLLRLLNIKVATANFLVCKFFFKKEPLLSYFVFLWQEIMLEFRAGKMSLQGTRVVPDARKGLVRIARVMSPHTHTYSLVPVARYWLQLI